MPSGVIYILPRGAKSSMRCYAGNGLHSRYHTKGRSEMLVQYTFEVEDIADVLRDKEVEFDEFLDPSVANYLVTLVNNLIDQNECEKERDWSQLQLLIAEADGLQTAFSLLATDAMHGVIEEIQPAIIQSLKEQGIL